jgi:hypothetical protein
LRGADDALGAGAGRDAGFGVAAGFGAGVDFKLLLPRALCGRPPAEPENAFGFVDGAGLADGAEG